jgi:hypothetical protein
MGHSGGRKFMVDKIGERVGMIGQGGGRKLGVSEIGGVWILFGQGGGRAEVIIIAGVYSRLLYRFRPAYSLGRGGGRNWTVGYGGMLLLLTCVGRRVSWLMCASSGASCARFNAVT